MRGYAVGLGLVAAALLLRLALDPVLHDHAPYLFFVFAVLVAGTLLGIGPGVLAMAASAVLATYFFVAPRFALLPLKLEDAASLISFLLISLGVLVFVNLIMRSRARELVSREAMLASETREKRLIDAARDYAIYELDSEGRILTWNKGAERLKGWKAEEIIGKPYHVLHTPESRAKNQPGRELEIAAATGRFEEEAPRMRKDGTIFAAHVSLFPLRDENGAVTGYVKVTRDISDRSMAGRAILESRQRLEGIVNSAMDAIITIDEQQRVVLFNPAAERMFGCSAQDALGKSVSHFIPERFRAGHDEHIRRFRETGVTNRRMGALGAISGLRASGEEFPIEASISQVTIGDETLSTVILRDITERKTSEEARNLLAREVDHRAKNALAVAQALVGLTRADSVEQFADAIRGRIASLARAHSLLSQSQWRGAPLDQLIRDELSPYAKESQVTIRGPALNCSAAVVQSMSLLIHELATNAVKHGALGTEKGHVTIRWKLNPKALAITWREEGGPKVSKPSEEGFGTKLLKQVTGRQLDAKLTFDWNPGGLRVDIEAPAHFFIPAVPDQSDGDTRGAAGVAGQLGQERRILIVEDEELIALELSAELSRLGWAVVGPAATLAEAQSLLSNGVDAAVLDVNLRGRAVYPVAEALQDRRVPFIFCTGYEMVDPEGRFANVPVLRKPAHPAAVSAALSDLLKTSAS
ncbi:MAG: PAS domain S-box protein [Alphaproteobacteria bacterium]